MLIRDFSNHRENNSKSFFQIANRIYKRKIHYSFRFPANALVSVESIVENLTKKSAKNCVGFKNWELFTTKNVIQSYESDESPLLIHDEAGRILNIKEYSDLLTIISDKTEKEGYLAVDIEAWENHKKLIKDEFSKYVVFPEKDPT